jgi:hypothetical protein
MHPVTTTPDYTEFESGTHPGSTASVFSLDFGNVGIQICFDIQFPEGWASLAAQGAKMVFWPSAYNGGFPLQAYAWHHHYYVVSSVQTDHSRIIDPLGTVLTQTDELLNLVWQDINLDYVVCHTDFNYDIPEWLIEHYPGKVAVHLHSDEGHFLVEPLVENLTIASLKQEFGFISVEEYNSYHREAFKQLHAGVTPVHQPALHGKRPMYAKTGGKHE